MRYRFNGVGATPLVPKKFVRGNSNDLVVVFEHQNFTMQLNVGRAIPPRQQARDDLGDFVKPLVFARAKIEVFQPVLVAAASVPENHSSIGVIDRTGPDGRQIGLSGFARGGVLRPPFARLRCVRFDGSLRTVMMRWIVDQRASRRPFSIRE
jgi:hypothetical protein